MSLQGQAKVSVSLIVSYDGRIVLEGESTGSKKLLLKFSKKKNYISGYRESLTRTISTKFDVFKKNEVSANIRERAKFLSLFLLYLELA